MWSGGILDRGRKVTNTGVSRIFGIPVRIFLFARRFLGDDCVLKTSRLKCGLPVFNSLLYPGHPLRRRRWVNVINDWLDRFRQLSVGILLLPTPYSDIGARRR